MYERIQRDAKTELVVNSLAAATTNGWYGDMIRMVRLARKASVVDIKNGLVLQEAARQNRYASEIEANIERSVGGMKGIAHAIDFLFNLGIFSRDAEGEYSISDIAEKHWTVFEPQAD